MALEETLAAVLGPDNPLPRDLSLFDRYMTELDKVLTDSEILVALNEFEISAARMRAMMVAGSDEVLKTAAPEYAVYQESVIRNAQAVGIGPGQITLGPRLSLADLLRWIVFAGAGAGAALLAAGLATDGSWPAAPACIGAGLALLGVVGTLFLSQLARNTHYGRMAIENGAARTDDSIELTIARNRLMAALSQRELVVRAWRFINEAREKRFDRDYTVSGSPGLSEVYDSINRVPTEISAELEGLLERLDGASIGIAGPRGSGKSMLIREYCEELPVFAADRRRWFGLDARPALLMDLRCMVAAPVDYASRDFVLHLFATFCGMVIRRYGDSADSDGGDARPGGLMSLLGGLASALVLRALVVGGTAAALWHWQHAIAGYLSVPAAWLRHAAVAVIVLGAVEFIWVSLSRVSRWRSGADEDELAATARRKLAKVGYSQTHSSGISGGISLPGGLQGQVSRGISRAEQPWTYPEIVDEFRAFARLVAARAHQDGSRVLIGIDELDKIGSAEQAERFLNEIKGIFGIQHLYFIVSMSHDALIAFERRGLPLRDAFDSSFDEIVEVGPLAYAESRRLLYRRIAGLNEPYVALCHCLAGGVARDLIRTARSIVKAAARLVGPARPDGVDAASPDPLDWLLASDKAPLLPLTIGGIADAVIRDELLRKLRAASYVACSTGSAASELLNALYEIEGLLGQDQPIIGIIDVLASCGSPEPAIAAVRLDLAAYVYFCATLQEVFTDQLDHERILAASSVPAYLGSFDALARARNTFALDTALAWHLITQFRAAWSMKTVKLP